MLVTQVYELMNDVTKAVLGETAVVNEDLSNVVDIGDELDNLNLQIDYIIANHGEQDHTGIFPMLLDKYPQAIIITNCQDMD